MKAFYFVAEIPFSNPHAMKLHVQPTADRELAVQTYQSLAHGKDTKKVKEGSTLTLGTLDFLRTHRASTAIIKPAALDTTPAAKA